MGMGVGEAVEMLEGLLPAYAYTPGDGDGPILRFAWQRAENRVRAFCNIQSIPDDLYMEVATMAIGEFFKIKKSTGQLNFETGGDGGLTFPHLVTQFTEGDTSLSMTPSGKNDEANFDRMIEDMARGNPWVLEHHRRLHW